MVKQFELIEHFDVSIQKFYSILLKEPTFEEQFHTLRGNSKINITEWMSLGNNHWQRLCFYTMEDIDKKGFGNFVCMETQKYYYMGDILRLDSTISPDNPSVGNLFNIKSEWTISQTSYGEQCVLKIFVEVECKRTIIGIQGMVEGTLASKVRSAYETWCSLALEKVKEEQEKQHSKNILESTKEIYDTNRERLHHRFKSLHERVVSGTENIVKLFQDRTNTPTPDGTDQNVLLEKEKVEEIKSIKGDLEEGSIPQVPLNGSNSSHREKRHSINPSVWFIIFFFLLIILLIYFIEKSPLVGFQLKW
jgi:hypothetical protein